MRERMRKNSPRAMRCASTSSRTRAGSPTSSSSLSTGRCCGRASTRRWRCSPTPSASWSRWPPRTWCRRRASTCSPGPIGSTAPRPICCSSRAPRSARRGGGALPRHTCRRDTRCGTRRWSLRRTARRYNPQHPWSLRPKRSLNPTRRTSTRSARGSAAELPMPQMYLWNSHPRVYLAVEESAGEMSLLRRGVHAAALRPSARRRVARTQSVSAALRSLGGGRSARIGTSFAARSLALSGARSACSSCQRPAVE